MSEKKKLVDTEVDDGVAVIRLNNPPRNTLTPSLMGDLGEAREAAVLDSVRVVIIAGLDRVFSVGGDLELITVLSSKEEAVRHAKLGQQIIRELFSVEKPFIAAVNGLCLGGGLEVAMSCHLRVCGHRARFGFPELPVGFIPAFGGVGQLARLVGRAKALEMLLTGRTVTADEAQHIGLVNRCVPARELMKEVKKLARVISRAEPEAARAALQLVETNDGAREAEVFGSLVSRPFVKKNLSDLVN
jgi:enoyl-CoA hydratase